MPLTPEQERLIKSIPYLIQNQKKPASSTTGSSFVFIGGAPAVGGNTISYFAPPTTTLTEAQVQFQVPSAGTISNLYLTTSNGQSSTGSYVITLRLNGVDQTVSITIAANASAGFFSDTSHSFKVAAGDKLSIKCANNASTTAATIQNFTFKFTPQ